VRYEVFESGNGFGVMDLHHQRRRVHWSARRDDAERVAAVLEGDPNRDSAKQRIEYLESLLSVAAVTLQAMLEASLRTDDAAWAAGVERAGVFRPCDAAVRELRAIFDAVPGTSARCATCHEPALLLGDGDARCHHHGVTTPLP